MFSEHSENSNTVREREGDTQLKCFRGKKKVINVSGAHVLRTLLKTRLHSKKKVLLMLLETRAF